MYGGLRTTLCDKCNKEVSNNNYNRHYLTCEKLVKKQVKTTLECRYCHKISKNLKASSSHQVKCPANINRNYFNGRTGKTAWNKGKTKESDASVAKYATTMKQNFLFGEVMPSGYCGWTSEHRSEVAKKQKFGGYRANAGHSKKFKVVDSFGKQVTLQSSYEMLCSEILNKLQIKWVRPSYLLYNNRKYYADFYLVDFDIYLDPKNDFKAKLDQEKIDAVTQQNNVNIFVLTQDKINEGFIKWLCS